MKSFTTFLCILLALCTVALTAPSSLWLKQDVTADFMEEDCSSESETNTLDDESANKDCVVHFTSQMSPQHLTNTHYIFWISHMYTEHFSQVVSPPPEYIF